MVYKGKESVKARVILDWEKVDSFLLSGCPGTEIAAYFGIHEDTLYGRCEVEKGMGWSAYMQSKKAKGDALLRHVQFQKAIKGSERMMIFLGEHRLGQVSKKDERELTDDYKIAIGQLNCLQHELKMMKEKHKKDKEPKIQVIDETV